MRAGRAQRHGALLKRGDLFAPSVPESYRRVSSRALIAGRNLYARSAASHVASLYQCRCTRFAAHNSLTRRGLLFKLFKPRRDPKTGPPNAVCDVGQLSRQHLLDVYVARLRMYARGIPRDVWQTPCDQMGPVQNFVSRDTLSATTLTPGAYRARNRYLAFRLSEKPRREPQEFAGGAREIARPARQDNPCDFIELCRQLSRPLPEMNFIASR